jgi:tetratricopeptide (TPR) repeat protein
MHLSPEDQRHLEAAEGWLELGNHIEGNKELDEIEPASRVHPDVLQVRWLVFAKAKNWIACLDIAEALINIAPERRFGWLHKAFSLDNLERTDEARQTLLEAVERFEPNATLPYYLATYCAKLGHREEAAKWIGLALNRAKDEGELKRMRLKALDDPNLETFWRALE